MATLPLGAQVVHLFEDFSTATGSTPPVGWTQQTLVGNPAVDTWRFNNPGNRLINPPMSPPVAIFDSDNYSNNSLAEDVVLISPVLDLSAQTVVNLSFDHFFLSGFGGRATVEVFDGNAWVQVYDNSATTTPNPQSLNLDISAQAAGNPNTQVRFRWRGNYSWHWSVDNVRISSPAANDARMVRILAPNSGCGFGLVPISVLIANAGSAPISNFPVSYTVNGSGAITETITATIAPGDSLAYTFAGLADLSTPGSYTLVAYTDLAGDGARQNDTASRTIQSLATISVGSGYLEDFESGPGGWTTGGTNNSWALGTPANTIINSAAPGGVNSWITNLTGPYNNNEQSFVVSPCFDLSGLSNPRISFDIWWQSEANWDGAVLQSSLDGGATWQRIGSVGTGINWYNMTNLAGLPGGQAPGSAQGWGGRVSSNNGSNGWVKAEHDLTPLIGQTSVRFRIAFGSDASINDNGVAFDNVRIFDPPANDMSVVSLISPESDCGLGATETVTVRVANLGSAAQSNVPVRLSSDGGQTFVTEFIAGPIAPADTITYTFTATVNMSTPGDYDLVILTDNADINLDNDTLFATVRHLGHDFDLGAYTQGFEATDDLEGWLVFNMNLDNSTWTIQNNAANARTGSGFAQYSWNATNPANDWLVSRCFLLEAGTEYEISFWYRVASATWTERMHLWLGTAADPAAMTDSLIDLGTFNNTTWQQAVRSFQVPVDGFYYFGWHAYSAANQDQIRLDDINIRKVVNTNLGVTALTSPTTGCGLSSNEPVTVQVKNFGADTVFGNFLVGVQVDGGSPFFELKGDTIAPGQTVSITLNNGVDLSGNGQTYTLQAFTVIPGDGIPGDDTSSATVTHIQSVSTFPYFENFDNGPGGWTSGGTLNSWAFGTPAKTVINSAASTPNSWVTGGLGTGLYNNNEQSFVISPCFNLSSIAVPRITLDVWWNSEFSWDGAALQATTDNGATWLTIGNFGDPNNWYNDNSINGNPGGQQLGWTGRISTNNGSGGWLTASNTAPTLGNEPRVRFRIAFGADASINDDGFAFDNFRVEAVQPIDVALTNILQPTDGCEGPVNVSVILRNNGADPISNIPVTAIVPGLGTINATYTGTINFGQSDTLVLGTLTAVQGSYTVTVFSSVAGDPNPANDTLRRNVQFYSSFAVSATPDTTVCANNAFVLRAASPSGFVTQWFRTAAGGFITSGDSIALPAGLSADSTFYARSYAASSLHSLGPVAGDFGTFAQSTIVNAGLIFDTDAPMFIETVKIYPVGTGSITVQLRDAAANVLQSRVIPITGAVAGDSLTIPLGFNVPQGTGWRLVTSAFTGITLRRHSAGVSFPYVTPGTGTITDGTLGGFYYYFYDWKVRSLLCEGPLDSTVVTVVPSPNPNLGQDTLVCQGSTVTLTPGAGFTSYNWSTGATTASLTVNQGGVYWVEVSNAGGCARRDTIVVTEQDIRALINLPTVDTLCVGESRTLNATLAGATYLWSTGATTASINFSLATARDSLVSVFVTSAQGCTELVDVQLTVVAPPAVNLGPDRQICTGGNTVLDATTAGATSYLWNTGATTPTINVSTAGTYWVEATGRPGCSRRDTITVTVVSPIVANAGADQSILCGATANLLASATGGNGIYSFQWIGGPATAAYDVTAAGSYIVVVTDGLGCVGRDTVEVTLQGSTLDATIAPANTTICAGQSVDIVVTPSGGIAPYTLVWAGFPSVSGNTLTVSASGIYSVTVTDASGCEIIRTAEVMVNPIPVVDLGADQALCQGSSLTLDATQAGASYLWSTGATTATLSFAATNLVVDSLVWVEVTLNGCSRRDSILLTVNALPVVDLGPNDTLCTGATLTLDAGNAGSSYLWSDGSTGQTLSYQAASAGTDVIWVEVTNAQGCAARDTITFVVGQTPVVNLGADQNLCLGASLTLDAGNPGSSYLWSNGSTSQTLVFDATTLGSQTLSVTVTSALGCEATSSVTLTVFDQPSVNLGGDDTLCVGETLLLDAGNPGSTYLWSDGSTGQTLNFVASSAVALTKVWVRVTNAGGCIATDTISLRIEAAPVVNLGADSILCAGSAITLNAGNIGSTYLWSDGSTSQTLTVTAAGTYSVTVTNANGCSATGSLTISTPSANEVTWTLPDTVERGRAFGFAVTGAQSWTANFGSAASPQNVNHLNPSQTVTYNTLGNQSVTLSAVVRGCTVTVNRTVVVVEPTSRPNELTLHDLSISPNPADDHLWVRFGLPQAAPAEIRLVDVQGRVLQVLRLEAAQSFEQRLDLNGLAKGIYQLQIRSGTQTHVARILKP